MQETGVGWDPMYEARMPWPTKVFVLYLVLALLLSAFRALTLLRSLWSLRKVGKEGPGAEGRFQALWNHCSTKLHSIEQLSLLTFLLSVLLLAWRTSEILKLVEVQKIMARAFFAGAMAETLKTFSVGLLVSCMLYAFVIFCEGVLWRRKRDMLQR